MLLDVNLNHRTASRRAGSRLAEFGLNERGFQEVLFNSLDRLLPDDQLLLLAQSRNWREEPDLLALDATGRLYIFELKAFESQPENILQALRYGQLFGQYDYDQLAAMYRTFRPSGTELAEAHAAQFDVGLPPDSYNHDQVFVVMTNGLDVSTREAIQYWHARGLTVEPWVYRVYAGVHADEMLVEMQPYRGSDDPYEDLVSGFYVLNTNYGNDAGDDADMLANHKAAAFYEPWKYKIERLQRGDTVFLYRTGHGIVAYGRATGRLEVLPHHEYPEEQYAMPLSPWRLVDPPMTAAEIKRTTGVQHSFRGTMFSVSEEAARQLERALHARSQSD